jgi:hypothetical protein
MRRSAELERGGVAYAAINTMVAQEVPEDQVTEIES